MADLLFTFRAKLDREAITLVEQGFRDVPSGDPAGQVKKDLHQFL